MRKEITKETPYSEERKEKKEVAGHQKNKKNHMHQRKAV
jgi:hypothetical protein